MGHIADKLSNNDANDAEGHLLRQNDGAGFALPDGLEGEPRAPHLNDDDDDAEGHKFVTGNEHVEGAPDLLAR